MLKLRLPKARAPRAPLRLPPSHLPARRARRGSPATARVRSAAAPISWWRSRSASNARPSSWTCAASRDAADITPTAEGGLRIGAAARLADDRACTSGASRAGPCSRRPATPSGPPRCATWGRSAATSASGRAAGTCAPASPVSRTAGPSCPAEEGENRLPRDPRRRALSRGASVGSGGRAHRAPRGDRDRRRGGDAPRPDRRLLRLAAGGRERARPSSARRDRRGGRAAGIERRRVAALREDHAARGVGFRAREPCGLPPSRRRCSFRTGWSGPAPLARGPLGGARCRLGRTGRGRCCHTGRPSVIRCTSAARQRVQIGSRRVAPAARHDRPVDTTSGVRPMPVIELEGKPELEGNPRTFTGELMVGSGSQADLAARRSGPRGAPFQDRRRRGWLGHRRAGLAAERGRREREAGGAERHRR